MRAVRRRGTPSFPLRAAAPQEGQTVRKRRETPRVPLSARGRTQESHCAAAQGLQHHLWKVPQSKKSRIWELHLGGRTQVQRRISAFPKVPRKKVQYWGGNRDYPECRGEQRCDGERVAFQDEQHARTAGLGRKGAETRTVERQARDREPALAKHQLRRKAQQQPDEAVSAHPRQNQEQARTTVMQPSFCAMHSLYRRCLILIASCQRFWLYEKSMIRWRAQWAQLSWVRRCSCGEWAAWWLRNRRKRWGCCACRCSHSKTRHWPSVRPSFSPESQKWPARSLSLCWTCVKACLLVGVLAAENVDLVLADLQGQWILEDLYFLEDVPGRGAHQGPLVSRGVVHLDYLINIIELIESSQLADVAVAQRAHRRLPQRHVALAELAPLFLTNGVAVVLLWALFSFSSTSNQVDEAVHVEQGCVSLCCNQRPSVARLHIADLIEVGVDLLFGCPAVNCVNLAWRSDDALGLRREGPFIGEFSFVIVVFAERVDFACVSHWIVAYFFGVGDAVVKDCLCLVESFLKVGKAADDWPFSERQWNRFDLERSDFMVGFGCFSHVVLMIDRANCRKDRWR